MWEVETGRCVAQWTLTIAAGDDEDGIAAIAFNPNVELPLLAVAATSKVLVRLPAVHTRFFYLHHC